MSPHPDSVLLGSEEEARRLWSGALEARKRADEEIVPLFEALDLGVRAAEILVIQKLQGVKDRFPATIAAQLDTPDPDVDAERDSVGAQRALQFSDVLDLLSEEQLACASPRLHRGWEDRRFSCRRSRDTAHAALGFRIDENERNDLLLLAAYRNRLFREPPPVRIRPGLLLEAYGALESLMDRLLGD